MELHTDRGAFHFRTIVSCDLSLHVLLFLSLPMYPDIVYPLPYAGMGGGEGD